MEINAEVDLGKETFLERTVLTNLFCAILPCVLNQYHWGYYYLHNLFINLFIFFGGGGREDIIRIFEWGTRGTE